MLNSNKLFLESLLIFNLLLLPITKAESNEITQQVNQPQTKTMEYNEKIAKLESDQKTTANTITALQTSLNKNHQVINELKVKVDQLVEANAGQMRSANGHGRGGHK